MIAAKMGKHLRVQPAIANRLSDRIYPINKPQGTQLPAAVVSVVSGQDDYSLTGAIADVSKIVQVDVDSHNYIDAIEIAELIRTEIEYANTTWDETVVKSCTVQSERDISFPPTDGSDQQIYRRSVDYLVTYVR